MKVFEKDIVMRGFVATPRMNLILLIFKDRKFGYIAYSKRDCGSKNTLLEENKI